MYNYSDSISSFLFTAIQELASSVKSLKKMHNIVSGHILLLFLLRTRTITSLYIIWLIVKYLMHSAWKLCDFINIITGNQYQ